MRPALSQLERGVRNRGVGHPDQRTDAELLRATADDAEAFGIFYRRHVHAVLTYTLSRTRRPEIAADLTAEVFAAALEQHEGYDPRRAPARAWLFALAGSRLLDAVRSGRVEDRARRRLGIPARELTDQDLDRVEELIDLSRGFDAHTLVADLPVEQRDAVLARVVHERDYAQIAADLDVSQAVVRQRVSRGLGALRAKLDTREVRP